MIPVSTSYQEILDNGGHYEWQSINGANTFTKENLVSGAITSAMFEQLSIGNVISSQLKLQLRGVTVDPSSMLQVQFRTVNDTDSSSWATKGEFFVDTLEKSPYSEISSVTAFDALLKSETDFMPSGSYVPMTALEVAEMVADDIGVPLEESTKNLLDQNPITLSNAPNVGVGGTTDRDMLSYIATIYGGNWVIKWGYYETTIGGSTYIAQGETLTLLLPYNDPAYSGTVGDAVVSFDASNSEIVKRIKLWLDNETYYLAPTGYTEEQWLALGGRCIETKLPFYATQAIANSLLTKYNNKAFFPYSAQTAYLDPKYEVGDGVIFKTVGTVQSRIASLTNRLDPLAPCDLEFKCEEQMNSLYPYISSVERNTLYQVTQAVEAAENAETAVGNANFREQLIYISKASGTTSVAANTTWVTNSSGNQNTWTTKRPVYNSSYPVLFVATQRQSVDQSSGSTCTCTTPMIDQTTTVIDGGHITTGTIDASQVNVANINASNITSGTINAIDITGSTITGGSLTSATANGSVRIKDGSIDFFKNATTTGSPFSQIKHVYDSGQGDSIEWTNSGYTKLVNTGGGQWTADFLNFKINSSMQMQIYPDSDGYHTNITSDYVYIPGVLRATSDLAWALRQADVRNDNQAPSWYFSNNAYKTVSEFKTASVIGLNTDYYYANVTTITPWGDQSGGRPVQYASAGGRLYARLGADNSTWNSWHRMNPESVLLSSGVGSTETLVSSAASYYAAFIIIGTPSTNYQASCYIPKAALSSTATKWQVADEQRYIGCEVRVSGENVYAKVAASTTSGKTVDVYGLSGM